MEVEVNIDYEPRSQFIDYHERTQRWAVIVAHRRAGKTVATLNDIIRRACTCPLPDPRYAYIAPYFVQAKDIAWVYLKRFCEPLLRYGGSINESELRVMLPNAASIRLYGADNADRMRGLYFDGVALDEPADMAPRVWGEVIRPTLSDRGGWATFIGTPKGHNAFWDLWKRAERDPDWFSLRLKASETGLLPSVELAAARADLSEDQYEQEYETSFDAAIIGAILGRQISMAEREGRISDDVTYDPDGAPIEISSDIGRRDASAWWFWQPVVGGYRVVDFDLDSGLWAEEWINRLQNRIKAKGYKLGKIHLPHDARAKTFAAKHSVVEQFLMKYGPEIVRITPDSSKEDRINAARRVTSRCEFAASACAEGLDGLRSWQYEYDDERKEFSREPRHDWASHPGDAFSYGALILEERQPAPAPAPKPRFLAVGEANAVTLNDMWQSVQRPSERI